MFKTPSRFFQLFEVLTPSLDDQLRTCRVGPGALSSFVFWSAAANSAAVKSSEVLTLTDIAVDVVYRSFTFFDTIQVDLRSALSYFPFLKSWAAMAFVGTGQ